MRRKEQKKGRARKGKVLSQNTRKVSSRLPHLSIRMFSAEAPGERLQAKAQIERLLKGGFWAKQANTV